MINRISTIAENAHIMVSAAAHNKSDLSKEIKSFYTDANNTNQQSNALLYYYTAISNLKKNEGSRKSKEVVNTILAQTEQIPEIKEQAEIFEASLHRNYKSSLRNRILLMQSGAINGDNVKQISLWRQLKRVLRAHKYEE